MNGRPPVTDEGEGCGTFGCMSFLGLLFTLIYGYAYDLTVRQISLMVVGAMIGAALSWLLADTVVGAWRKWRRRGGHGGA